MLLLAWILAQAVVTALAFHGGRMEGVASLQPEVDRLALAYREADARYSTALTRMDVLQREVDTIVAIDKLVADLKHCTKETQ